MSAFGEVMAVIAAAYPGWKPTAKTLEVYAAALSDVPTPLLRAAAVAHVRESRFPPTVAELRALCHSGGGEPLAAEAWARVRGLVRSVGGYGTPVLTQPESKALAAVGGWKALCATQTADMPVVGAHFMRAYEASTARLEARSRLEAAAEDIGVDLEALEPGPAERLGGLFGGLLGGGR